MSQLRIGLVPEHSKYFVIQGNFTSNLRKYEEYMDTPFHGNGAYTSYVHRLNTRIENYGPTILEVPESSTLKDIKQQYPEHFI